jgi:tetratricopeptide (TPR) repeat protein
MRVRFSRILRVCIVLSFASFVLACTGGANSIEKQTQAKEEQLFEKERSTIAAFISNGKGRTDREYRVKYKALLTKYKGLVEQKPESSRYRYMYGFLLVRPKQKWNQFNQCLKNDADQFWCLIGRGNVYIQWKVKDRAAQDFNKAQKLRPNSLQPTIGLAEIAMIRQEDDKAVALFKKVLAKQSSNKDALFGLAALHQRKGKNREAISYYRRLLKYEPKHFEALRSTGNLHFKLKEMPQAAEAYDRAIKVRPRSFRLIVRLATICETHLSQKDRALTLYERASRLPQSHFHTYFRLGVLRGEKGKVDGGISALKQALRLQAEHPTALLALGKLYIRKPDADLAVSTLWKALRLNNGKVPARVALAKALQLKKDYAGVLQQYEAILKLEPNRSDIKSSMEAMLQKLGLTSDTFTGNSARKVFQKGKARVYKCYKARLKVKPKLKGKISLKLIITPAGPVERVSIQIDKTTLDDKLVLACVKWTYKRAIFPKISRKNRYKIESEFSFRN